MPGHRCWSLHLLTRFRVGVLELTTRKSAVFAIARFPPLQSTTPDTMTCLTRRINAQKKAVSRKALYSIAIQRLYTPFICLPRPVPSRGHLYSPTRRRERQQSETAPWQSILKEPDCPQIAIRMIWGKTSATACMEVLQEAIAEMYYAEGSYHGRPRPRCP